MRFLRLLFKAISMKLAMLCFSHQKKQCSNIVLSFFLTGMTMNMATATVLLTC